MTTTTEESSSTASSTTTKSVMETEDTTIETTTQEKRNTYDYYDDYYDYSTTVESVADTTKTTTTVTQNGNGTLEVERCFSRNPRIWTIGIWTNRNDTNFLLFLCSSSRIYYFEQSCGNCVLSWASHYQDILTKVLIHLPHSDLVLNKNSKDETFSRTIGGIKRRKSRDWQYCRMWCWIERCCRWYVPGRNDCMT